MEGDQKELHDKIESQEQLINKLKLKLTSKEMELAQATEQFGLNENEEDIDQTLEEGEGEENNLGLSGDFNKSGTGNSRLESFDDHSGLPLVDGDSHELSQLGGLGGMMGSQGERDYAEIEPEGDIFDQDNCKCA